MAKTFRTELPTGDLIPLRAFEKNFTALLKAVETPAVIWLNGPWGSGKSTFIERLPDLLGDDLPCRLINLWESDFSSDPLIAIIWQLFDGETSSWDSETNQKFKNLTMRLVSSAGKKAIQQVTGLDTNGLIDALNTEADRFVALHDQERKSIKELKKELRKLIPPNNGGRRLMIVIDELDRCRPTYAIETLERIKHLFDIEGLVFVISTDKRQLQASVRAVYGEHTDAQEYLRRFFDLEIQFPKISSRELFEKLLSRNTKRPDNAVLNLCGALLETKATTLRAAAQFAHKLNASRLAQLSEWEYAPLVIILIFVSITDPLEFQHLMSYEKTIGQRLHGSISGLLNDLRETLQLTTYNPAKELPPIELLNNLQGDWVENIPDDYCKDALNAANGA